MSATEKTEKPTQQRLKKESRKGKSFNSRDLIAAAVLWVGLPAAAFFSSLQGLAALYVDITRGGFALTPHAAAAAALKALLTAMAPILLVCIVCIALCSLAMSRGIIAAEAIRFDLARLNPVNGFKNLFSLKVVKDLVRTLLYLLCAGLFAWLSIHAWGPDVLALVSATPAQLAEGWRHIALMFALGLLLSLAPVYVLSGWLDHLLFIREMKMEKHEVKREHKENQMKPEIKQRRNEMAEDLPAQVAADTAGSRFVLANPTHIAIGIFLMDDDMPMPFVSVREKGKRARQVIALAEASGIPVLRDVRLARAIYFSTRRYQFVSNPNIDAVMEVVRWLRDVERASAPETGPDERPDQPDPLSNDGATA